MGLGQIEIGCEYNNNEVSSILFIAVYFALNLKNICF